MATFSTTGCYPLYFNEECSKYVINAPTATIPPPSTTTYRKMSLRLDKRSALVKGTRIETDRRVVAVESLAGRGDKVMGSSGLRA